MKIKKLLSGITSIFLLGSPIFNLKIQASKSGSFIQKQISEDQMEQLSSALNQSLKIDNAITLNGFFSEEDFLKRNFVTILGNHLFIMSETMYSLGMSRLLEESLNDGTLNIDLYKSKVLQFCKNLSSKQVQQIIQDIKNARIRFINNSIFAFQMTKHML